MYDTEETFGTLLPKLRLWLSTEILRLHLWKERKKLWFSSPPPPHPMIVKSGKQELCSASLGRTRQHQISNQKLDLLDESCVFILDCRTAPGLSRVYLGALLAPLCVRLENEVRENAATTITFTTAATTSLPPCQVAPLTKQPYVSFSKSALEYACLLWSDRRGRGRGRQMIIMNVL